MRYRRYKATRNADGSVTVVSHGPFVALGTLLRLPVALVFIGTAIVAMVQGQWSTGGVALLIGAVILPNYAKRRKIAARDAGPPSPRGWGSPPP